MPQLTHGARVVLRKALLKATEKPAAPPAPVVAQGSNPTPTPAPAAAIAPPPQTHMIVFRNQQGIFIPGLSDNDEVQYWRILSADEDAIPGQHLRDGSHVRLCWRFQDQTTGWRDWVDDVFGRRRAIIPPGYDADAVLYLKLPWPRFNNVGEDSAHNPQPHPILLAPVPQRAPQRYDFKVLAPDGKSENSTFCTIQDVIFRIDTVANGGFGDAPDYLLRNVIQDKSVAVTTLKMGAMSIAQASFWL